jgi:hypothetical protein
VTSYSLHKNLRADPYAGLADPDELGRPDSPSPRSQPHFNGAFASPPLGKTPRSNDEIPVGKIGEESASDPGEDLGFDSADTMYDAMPRSGSFIENEQARPLEQSQAVRAAPSAAPTKTGFEILGRARPHYLDEMSAENQRRLWAEAEGD